MTTLSTLNWDHEINPTSMTDRIHNMLHLLGENVLPVVKGNELHLFESSGLKIDGICVPSNHSPVMVLEENGYLGVFSYRLTDTNLKTLFSEVAHCFNFAK